MGCMTYLAAFWAAAHHYYDCVHCSNERSSTAPVCPMYFILKENFKFGGLTDNSVDCVFSVARLRYFNWVMASDPVTELKLGICMSSLLSPALKSPHNSVAKMSVAHLINLYFMVI